MITSDDSVKAMFVPCTNWFGENGSNYMKGSTGRLCEPVRP